MLAAMTEAFPLIEVSGPPRERGRQYGRQAAGRIALGVEHYAAQLARSSCDWPTIRGLVQDYLPQIEAFEPAYVEEMRGIAEGAGLDFEAIVLLNARTEILKLGQRRGSRPERAGEAREPASPDNAREPASPEEACTGVVALPSATQSRRLIHAQNWDWKVECAETAVVLCIRREDGPDLLTFTEAGGLARSGLNAAGIAITANYLESDRDYRQTGVPLPLIRRKVLESEHLALAMRAVYATPKSAANNMIVSHAGGIAIDFECAPDETFQVHPERGLIVHANHWVSPVALAKLKDTGIANTPCTLYRDLRVRELLAPQIGTLTRDAVKAALFDDFAAPWSVCRPPRETVNGTMTATVAMIVMEPALGLMEVAPLPALNRRFTTYRLAVGSPAAVPA
jgi:isopenicillin-N N-acyltransferase like protein